MSSKQTNPAPKCYYYSATLRSHTLFSLLPNAHPCLAGEPCVLPTLGPVSLLSTKAILQLGHRNQLSCCTLLFHESPQPALQDRGAAFSIPPPPLLLLSDWHLLTTLCRKIFSCPGALWPPASPKAKKLSGAGAELCLGLRGAHKRKIPVLGEGEQRWSGLEGYTDNTVMGYRWYWRVFTSRVEGGNRSASSQSCDLCRNRAWNKPGPGPTVFPFFCSRKRMEAGKKGGGRGKGDFILLLLQEERGRP